MLTKMVNGVPVVLSEAEEAATRAEWAENAAKPPIVPDVHITQSKLVEILKAVGLDAATVDSAVASVYGK